MVAPDNRGRRSTQRRRLTFPNTGDVIMGPHRLLRNTRLLAVAAGVAISISAFSTTRAFAGETATADVSAEFAPGVEGSGVQAPATYFSINAVLAKHDRLRGR